MGWEGLQERAGQATTDSDCDPDPDFMTIEQVAAAFPASLLGEPVRERAWVQVTDASAIEAEAFGYPGEAVPFVIVSIAAQSEGQWFGHAIRVEGACAQDLLDGFARTMIEPEDPDWPVDWRLTRIGGRDVYMAAIPEGWGGGPGIYVLPIGDVGIMAYSDYPGLVSDFFARLVLPGEAGAERLDKMHDAGTASAMCQVPAGGMADMGDTSALAAMVGDTGGLVGEYQVVATEVQEVTPEILEQTCMIVANRLNATTASVPVVRVVGGDRVQVLLEPTTDEARIRSLIGTTGVLEFMPVLGGCIDETVPGAPSPDCLAETEPLFNGTEIASASVGQDSQTGQPVIDLELKDTGARILDDYAEQNLHGYYAIVLDDIVESVPRIDAPHLGGRARIIGNFSVSEIENLVIVLRFGSLPLEIREVGFQELDAVAGGPSSGTGRFSATGSMSTGDVGGATRLADGRVAVLHNHWTVNGESTLYDDVTIELFDPSTGAFARGDSLRVPRGGTSMAALADGRLVIVGGSSAASPPLDVVSVVEVYDPTAGRVKRAGRLAVLRAGAVSALLGDGLVLVAGGTDGSLLQGTCCTTLSSAEIYDPATGQSVPTGSMLEAREHDSAFVLPDGRVLLVGGQAWTPQGTRILTTTAIYDPATGVFESGLLCRSGLTILPSLNSTMGGSSSLAGGATWTLGNPWMEAEGRCSASTRRFRRGSSIGMPAKSDVEVKSSRRAGTLQQHHCPAVGR